MTTNINEILNRRAADAKKPITKPVGTAELTIVSHEYGQSAKKKTPYVRFHFRVDRYISLDNPEDQSVLDAIGDISSSKPLQSDFYLTPEAEYRATKFCADTLGLDPNQSFASMFPQAKGLRCIGYITKRPAKPDDPTNEDFFNDISGFAKIA